MKNLVLTILSFSFFLLAQAQTPLNLTGQISVVPGSISFTVTYTDNGTTNIATFMTDTSGNFNEFIDIFGMQGQVVLSYDDCNGTSTSATGVYSPTGAGLSPIDYGTLVYCPTPSNTSTVVGQFNNTSGVVNVMLSYDGGISYQSVQTNSSGALNEVQNVLTGQTDVYAYFFDCNNDSIFLTAANTSNLPQDEYYDFGTIDYCPTSISCVAGFTSSQSNVINGNTGNVISTGVVMITNTSQGQNLTYTWDFGDGSPAYTGVNFFHTYANAGPYIVCLTISSAATGSAPACSDTYCDSLMVDSNGVLTGKTNGGFSVQMGDGSDITSGTTAINTIDEAISLNIYPNPAKDFITIALDSRENAQVIIYDLTGKMVQQNDLNGQAKVNVSIENLNKGIYLVKVKTDKGFITRKLSVK